MEINKKDSCPPQLSAGRELERDLSRLAAKLRSTSKAHEDMPLGFILAVLARELGIDEIKELESYLVSKKGGRISNWKKQFYDMKFYEKN